ncbi:hypothetical protein P9D43_29125 [Neobacillus niacini]|uniref:hypothetical protein n=1 Tax=Neobacillus niacini TaxID=86668 RepID=UPI0007ABBE62|nr:hypothetical protein [Neobacillus niacini]MEC1526058.1 hypothetical protein [Neobacillus niacini]
MGLRNCPQQLTQCEGSQCQELRSQIASNNYDAAANLVYTYTPVNTPFEIADNFCQGLESNYSLATINQLEQLAHMFMSWDENGNVYQCPTLVWSKDENGTPVIVRMQPCSGDKIEIIRDFIKEICMAHVICVVQPT